MAHDETALPLTELEQSQQSAAQLLDNFARKLKVNRAVRHATGGIQRAANYVQAHSVKDMATGMERIVRQRPVPSLLVAVLAGFVIGFALCPKGDLR